MTVFDFSAPAHEIFADRLREEFDRLTRTGWGRFCLGHAVPEWTPARLHGLPAVAGRVVRPDVYNVELWRLGSVPPGDS